MEHDAALVRTIAVGLTAAFIGGFVARRLRLPAIVGYLLAGVVIGPFTPGLHADPDIATELAEIGVVLLMFGVGIHFSIRDLLAVRAIAVPGALGQIAVATLLGVGLGIVLGWGIGGGLVLGLAVSVASTIVLLRALMDRRQLESPEGRIAVGWLIVEDLFTVVLLVLLPVIAPFIGGTAEGAGAEANPVLEVGVAVGKATLFAVLMVVVGARILPSLLAIVARDGSRELFTLAVLAVALGLAFAASSVFGVSLALGAFLAGAVVGESDLSHQAAADAIPLRDAFAVLFFVSVGMLFDPAFLLTRPIEVVAVVALVVVAKSLTAFGIVAVLGYPARVALTVGAALAQIGEFSFIVATLGAALGLLPPAGYQLIVAGAIFSITLNPLMFRTAELLEPRLRTAPAMRRLLEWRGRDLRHLAPMPAADALEQHTIICGYGRVGRIIGPALARRGFRSVVVTTDRRVVEALRREGKLAIYGDASHAELLVEAGIDRARAVIAAVNDPHVTQLVVDSARRLNPRVEIVARTHSDHEAARLRTTPHNAQAVFGERELAVQMLRYVLRRYGLSANEVELIAQGTRRAPGPPTGPTSGGSRSRGWRNVASRTRSRLAQRAPAPIGDERAANPRPSTARRQDLLDLPD